MISAVFPLPKHANDVLVLQIFRLVVKFNLHRAWLLNSILVVQGNVANRAVLVQEHKQVLLKEVFKLVAFEIELHFHIQVIIVFIVDVFLVSVFFPVAAWFANPEAQHALPALVELLLALIRSARTNLLYGALHEVKTGSRRNCTALTGLLGTLANGLDGVLGA